jgi:hypothetical protein
MNVPSHSYGRAGPGGGAAGAAVRGGQAAWPPQPGCRAGTLGGTQMPAGDLGGVGGVEAVVVQSGLENTWSTAVTGLAIGCQTAEFLAYPVGIREV